MSNLRSLLRELQDRGVRYLTIGVWGVNLFAESGAQLFSTQDTDLFLPPDPENLVRAWEACESLGLDLWSGPEPLDQPRDLFLARAVVERRALTRATDEADLVVDFTLVMAGHDFEGAWNERSVFTTLGIELPVARLFHILESKRIANRPKDRLFLETYREILDDLLKQKRGPPWPSKSEDPECPS